MVLLSALWLAVVQALASSAVPAGPYGSVDARWRLVGVAVTAEETTAAHARRLPSNQSGLWAALLGDEQFRAPASQRLPAVDRTSDRGIPPLRSPLGLAAAPADLALSFASISPLAGHQVSHAAASRGGHLPYYPTAPPLQG